MSGICLKGEIMHSVWGRLSLKCLFPDGCAEYNMSGINRRGPGPVFTYKFGTRKYTDAI